jgi:hypothetical protein
MKPKAYLLPLQLQNQRTKAQSLIARVPNDNDVQVKEYVVARTCLQTLVRLGTEYLMLKIAAEKKECGRVQEQRRRQPVVTDGARVSALPLRTTEYV